MLLHLASCVEWRPTIWIRYFSQEWISELLYQYKSIGTLCNRTYYCTALIYLHTEYNCCQLQFLEILPAAESISKNERKSIMFCGIIQNIHDKWVPATKKWRVLRLRMEERPPVWRVAANILNNSREQPTRGGPPDWGLGEVLTTPHRKKVSCYEIFTRKGWDLAWFSGTAKETCTYT